MNENCLKGRYLYMKKLYEAPEMEELLVVSERVMSPSEDTDSDNEWDVGDLVGDILTP